MTSPSHDHRQHPRFSVDVQANARTADGRKLPARTRDLSRTGICLITTDGLKRGDELMVDLILCLGPNSFSEPLPLKAHVVWCTSIAQAFQVGAVFDPLTEQQNGFLDMFMRYADGSILPRGAEIGEGENSEEESDDVEMNSPPPDVKDDPFRS